MTAVTEPYPHITTDMIDGDDHELMPHELPECFTLELAFPGYIRGLVVAGIANDEEEKAPGYIRRLPKDLAVECAHVDHACWLAENDPIEVNWDHPSLAAHQADRPKT